MLDTLRRIVQEVNSAENLNQALDIIVARVREALQVDVCSVYLVLPGQEDLVLMATEGLNPESVSWVRLRFNEGLVGLVAQRAEYLNLDNAPLHPRFKYFPETGEERYHAYLGVPIIQHRQSVGVLVVQQREQRRFDEEHVAFLITLAAQLAGAISHAEVMDEVVSRRPAPGQTEVLLSGVAGSPGIGLGVGLVAYSPADLDAIPDRAVDAIEDEVAEFREAVAQVQSDLGALKERMGELLPAEEQVLFDAYVMMLGGDTLVERTVELIRAGNWAPGALRESVRESAGVFEEMDDPYLRERATDIRDIGRRILSRLQQAHARDKSFPERTILVGDDLTASQLAEVPPERLAGIVSARGSGSSHVAILARAMGVPAVMGVADLPAGRMEGREIVLDGYGGRLYIEPSRDVREEFLRLAEEERELTEGLRDLALEPAVAPDGDRVPVYANSGLLADIKPSLESGAEGIGLHRTEVPFMVRERFPSEDEQCAIYRQVLESFPACPVTLRTLDVGGDKSLSYFPVKEDNPFLGWRGIRITLDHPEIFLTQIRAMLRASEGLDNLQVLFPMVSSLNELSEALNLVARARGELLDEGVVVPAPRTGVMVEVPSSVYLAEEFAREVDFLSVGTNDLIQYLLAVDRNNARVAGLYRALHPAVLRALVQTVDGGHRAGKPVGICGEMAADPAAVILLLGMGVDSLSVSVGSLPKVKWVVRSFTRRQATDLLQQALATDDPAATRALLDEALVEAGLGGLVRAGKR